MFDVTPRSPGRSLARASSRLPAGRRSGPVRSLPLLALMLLLLAAACTPVGVPPEPPEPEPEPELEPLPALEEGELDEEEAEEARALLDDAAVALEEGDFRQARSRAIEVVERHPLAPGSVEALRIISRAALELGDYGEAFDAAADFESFLQDDETRIGEARILQGRARIGQGRRAEGLDHFLSVPGGARGAVREEALASLREHVQGVDGVELAEVVDRAPPGPGLLVLRTEVAVRHHLGGEDDEAREVARRILEEGPAPEEERIARAIVDGRADEVVGTAAVLGALLPESGSPSLRRFAEELQDGIEVAMARAGTDGRRAVRLLARDDEGSAATGRRLLASLEQEGVLALIGPLQEDALEEVARARSRPVPLLSPTVRVVPSGLEAVYSLGAVDEGGPRALATHARDVGFATAVILRPRGEEAEMEAGFFREAFRELGGRVVDEVLFERGQSNFPEEMRRILNARPEVLFLPLTPEEIAVVAPQIAFHGVDDGEILILGTEAWGSEEVLRSLPARYQRNVVAAVRAPAGAVPAGYRTFEAAYEDHFRRTLRSPVAALGWDAVQLLLAAVEDGARSPEDVRRGLESITEFEGATGLISFRDGRIVREYEVVRIRSGGLEPVQGDR